jgi:ATP adenylyltransferase
LDHLWSPWRLDYVTAGTPPAGCVFCLAAEAAAKADLAAGELVVFRGVTAYVVLNRYPYNNGHLMVVPMRHVATLMELSGVELQEIAVLTQRAEAVLRQAYRLDGINVGINLGKAAGAGIHEHLHVHLVPRWSGDTNFMTVVGDTRVLPEDLASTAARLSPIFATLATAGRDQST